MVQPAAKLDPDLKLFRDLVQSGIRPAEAYRRIFSAGKKITRQGADKGAKTKMGLLAAMSPHCNLFSSTQPAKRLQQPNRQPPPENPPENKSVKLTKEQLINRLCDTVIAGTNPEATAAARQLMEWMTAQDQQDQDAARLDPGLIARYLCQWSGGPCGPDDLQDVLDGVCAAMHVTPNQIRSYRLPVQVTPTLTCNDLQQEPQKITEPIIDNSITDNKL